MSLTCIVTVNHSRRSGGMSLVVSSEHNATKSVNSIVKSISVESVFPKELNLHNHTKRGSV